MFPYIVRLAKESEIYGLPEVERLAARRFLPYVERLEISTELLEGLTPITFLRRAQVEHRLWVAVPDVAVPDVENSVAAPIGFVAAKFWPGHCFVIEISVHPDHGRKGVGAALIEACCEGAMSRGARQVSLTTFRYVPWNIPFYRKVGFEVVADERLSPEIRAIVQHEERYGFKRSHRVVMRRRLGDGALGNRDLGHRDLGDRGWMS